MKKEPNSDTLVSSVADRLYVDLIASGLQEGDLFMTGDEVAQRYKVSRTVAREALSQLRALGVLKSRQKKGLLVARPDPVMLTSRWVPMYGCASEPKAFRALAQLRYVLEVGSVDLAVDNASNEGVERLSELAHEFERLAAGKAHSTETDRLDLEFHRTVLEMTGNPLVSGMHGVLVEYFLVSPVMHPVADTSKAIREHHMVVHAFRTRDKELARSLLRTHLERPFRRQE